MPSNFYKWHFVKQLQEIDKNESVTYGRTDGRTDRREVWNSYLDVWTDGQQWKCTLKCWTNYLAIEFHMIYYRIPKLCSYYSLVWASYPTLHLGRKQQAKHHICTSRQICVHFGSENVKRSTRRIMGEEPNQERGEILLFDYGRRKILS